MSAPDDHDPMLTRALGVWAEAAVPALPDDFTAAVMADVAAQRAGMAWAESAVPELPAGFAAMVAARAAARPRLQVLDGGPAEAPAAPAATRAWRRWQWPAAAVAAAGLLALLSSRSTPMGGSAEPVARRPDVAVPRVPAVVADPVEVAMAEVTRVEVLGAQSVAVLSIQGEGGGSGSPVVWITDKAEDDPAGALETRMQ